MTWKALPAEADGAAPQAAVPDGRLVYAIGDIHGRADLLHEVLGAVSRDAMARGEAGRCTLVFVGDYVDRGPDSRAVIETLISGLPKGFDCVALKGNHEDIMLNFLADPAVLPLWLHNGAAATLASYDAGLLDLVANEHEWGRVAQRLTEAMPGTHHDFIRSLRLSASIGDYLFAHAGVRPGVPLDRQNPEDLVWIRREFLESDADFGKVVVHGHTPGPLPVVRRNRIGIDTGAWTSGRLTALRLAGAERAVYMTGAD